MLEAQSELRAQMEREPVHFFVRALEPLLDRARTSLARFLEADPEGLVFVPNATAGVNTILRSVAESLTPGDELLVTDHEYNACRNALDAVAARTGAVVRVVRIPFPIGADDQIITRIEDALSPRTRLLLIDHVTSPTALVLPLEPILRACRAREVDVLVDGAHAPGMVPVSVDALSAAGMTYYTGNCHKWICAPKGAAFLWVAADRRGSLDPLSVSHGRNSTRRDRSRLRLMFDWTGTWDPTPYLCVPVALEFLGCLVPGGWPELRERNHALVASARRRIIAALMSRGAFPGPLSPGASEGPHACGVGPGAPTWPCPEPMLGSMASIPLPPSPPVVALPPSRESTEISPFAEFLWREHRIEVPINVWPAAPHRVVRISAQLYNDPGDYDALAAALVAGLSLE